MYEKMKLLLVEDDQDTADYIIRGFQEHGFVMDHAGNGNDGLALGDGEYDVLIIDRMIPELDGLKLVRILRRRGVKTPVIFLTAMGQLDDRVEGLEEGDDYLVKPFSFAELYARVGALARRPPLVKTETVLKVLDLEMDLVRREVKRNGKTVDLQPTEFRLLEYLMRHHSRVVTRTMLLEHVWNFNFDPKTSVVETHISRLRAKIDRGFGRELIKTIRNSGYMLDA